MNSITVICFVLWIYILSIFKRAKTDYFYYLCGSIGIFVFCMITIQPFLTKILMNVVTSISGLIGQITSLYSAYQDYNIIFVENLANQTSISLCIDYECAGIIEMLAFVSLVAFFQVYDVLERVIISIMGCISIFIFNIIRIFCICITVYYGGNDMYYIAHTLIGRMIFYAFSVILYYRVFTYAQIKRQRIGGFSYTKGN